MAIRGLLILMAASVGVVALVAVLVWPGDRGGEGAGQPGMVGAGSPGSGPMQGLGVRGEDVDSARRGSSGAIAARSQKFLVGAEAVEADEAKRRAPAVAPEPTQPLPPSAAAVAESDAIMAARPQVLAAVEGSLAARHAAIRDRCWEGDVPGPASFPVEVTYSAEGTQLGLSVGDDRGAPGVGACVRGEMLVPQTIAAPGVAVTITTALTLP